MVMKRNIRAAKAAAALLVGVSVLGIQLPVVQAADSQGLPGSYIGIGTAPEESKVVKKGQEIGSGRVGVVDYRSVNYIGKVGDNADGEGVKWGFNQGLFAGGYGAYATGDYSTALGTYAAAESDSTALGAGTVAKNNSLAVGKNSYAGAGYSFGAVAVGVNAKSFEDVAIGYGATAGRFYDYVQGDGIQTRYSEEDVSIGNKSTAVGGVAVGARATSGGRHGTAIGYHASVGYSGVALGTKASVTVDTGVALGVQAVADRAMGTYGYIPFADDTNASLIPTNDSELTAAIGARTASKEHSQALLTYKSTEGAVSVGVSGSQTRQIINVAAGTEDTDAVNVAQLKRVADEIGKKANLDASNLTDGDVTAWQQKLGNGTVTAGNTGLVTGGRVYDALEGKADTNLSNITAAGETVISNIAKDSIVVKAGTNVTVDEVTVGNAKTYTVNVSKDAIKDAVQADLDKKADATYVDSELDKKADKDAGNLTADMM